MNIKLSIFSKKDRSIESSFRMQEEMIRRIISDFFKKVMEVNDKTALRVLEENGYVTKKENKGYKFIKERIDGEIINLFKQYINSEIETGGLITGIKNKESSARAFKQKSVKLSTKSTQIVTEKIQKETTSKEYPNQVHSKKDAIPTQDSIEQYKTQKDVTYRSEKEQSCIDSKSDKQEPDLSLETPDTKQKNIEIEKKEQKPEEPRESIKKEDVEASPDSVAQITEIKDKTLTSELEPKHSAPKWEVLEPEDRSDPVKHEDLRTINCEGGWRIIGASRRGKLHAHRAMWREDAFVFDYQKPWSIIAVADGAGSSKLSRVGSRIACETSVNTLKELLWEYQLRPVKNNELDKPEDNELKRILFFLEKAAIEARNAIIREAHIRENKIDNFSTTLLLAIHTRWNNRNFVGAIQVGDGVIATWNGKEKLSLLGEPDHGESSGETLFLTSTKIEREFNRRVKFSIPDDMKYLAVMTDGVADDFYPEETKLPILFKILEEKVLSNPEPDKELLEWLKYTKKGSSDDRTLVMLYNPHPELSKLSNEKVIGNISLKPRITI